MSRIAIGIIDDHAVLRAGLRLLIEAHPSMRVVGEAGSLRDGLELVREHRPDVAILDLSMPDSPGLPGIDRLREASPATRVLVLTMHDDPAFVRGALARGASGYVSKASADTRLIEAILAVHEGKTFVEAAGRDAPMPAPHGAEPTPRPPLAAMLDALSERERAVLADVARGRTSKEIAEASGLSIKTVESYRARGMHKLDLRSRADLVRVAIESGLLSEPPKA